MGSAESGAVVTAAVVSPSASVEAQRYLQAYGAIEGRVQTLTSHGGLRFVLYDALFGKAVYCYLEAGNEELMRGAWDRRAVVEGWVSRDPTTGRPVSVRRVSVVNLLDDLERGSYRKARGARRRGSRSPSTWDDPLLTLMGDWNKLRDVLVEIKDLASDPWASEVVALRACLLAAFDGLGLPGPEDSPEREIARAIIKEARGDV